MGFMNYVYHQETSISIVPRKEANWTILCITKVSLRGWPYGTVAEQFSYRNESVIVFGHAGEVMIRKRDALIAWSEILREFMEKGWNTSGRRYEGKNLENQY